MTLGSTSLATVSAEHRCIVSTGEIIRAESWNSTHDHRVAVYVPGQCSAEIERAVVEFISELFAQLEDTVG